MDSYAAVHLQRLESAIARHRNDPPVNLPFNLRLDTLLDSNFCEEITKLLGHVCSTWEIRTASQALYHLLPSRAGLYMFVWRPKLSLRASGSKTLEIYWVLYVGRAGGKHSNNTLKARFRSEYRQYLDTDPEELWSSTPVLSRKERLNRYLSLRPLEFWYSMQTTEGYLEFLEDKLLQLLSPPLNVQKRALLRPIRSISAF